MRRRLRRRELHVAVHRHDPARRHRTRVPGRGVPLPLRQVAPHRRHVHAVRPDDVLEQAAGEHRVLDHRAGCRERGDGRKGIGDRPLALMEQHAPFVVAHGVRLDGDPEAIAGHERLAGALADARLEDADGAIRAEPDREVELLVAPRAASSKAKAADHVRGRGHGELQGAASRDERLRGGGARVPASRTVLRQAAARTDGAPRGDPRNGFLLAEGRRHDAGREEHGDGQARQWRARRG